MIFVPSSPICARFLSFGTAIVTICITIEATRKGYMPRLTIEIFSKALNERISMIIPTLPQPAAVSIAAVRSRPGIGISVSTQSTVTIRHEKNIFFLISGLFTLSLKVLIN